MNQKDTSWLVKDWMSTNILVVPPDVSVREAFITLRKGGMHHLLVVDDEKMLGIVSDRDLRRPDVSDDPQGWDEFYRLDEDYEVCDVMTMEVVSVSPHTTLSEAVNILVKNKFHALPVLDDEGKPLGVLSAQDLLKVLQKLL